jgi:hypothetical protein
MELPTAPPRSIRLAAVGLWIRAALNLLALLFGSLAASRPKPSDEWFTPWWWYLQEAHGWVALLLGFGLANDYEGFRLFLGAVFVAMSALYTVLGARVWWGGGRTARRLATALMLLTAAQSALMLYWTFGWAARDNRSIAPLGDGVIADRLTDAALFLWPLMLLGLALAVVVFANTRAAREYPSASDRMVSAGLLAWKDSSPDTRHPG